MALAVCISLTAGSIAAFLGVAKAHQTRPPSIASGAATLSLTLADAVFIGLRNNLSIRCAYTDREAQRFDLKVAEDVFTPHAVIAASVNRAASTGASVDSVSLSPAVTELTPIGTSVSLAWSNNASRTVGAQSMSSLVTASFVQPLLKGAGLEVNMAPVKTARLTDDIIRLNLRTTISQTVTSIIGAYRALLSAEEARVLDVDGVARAQSLLDTDAALIQAGRMARVELIQAQAALESQKLVALQDELQVETARFALATFLDINLRTNIRTIDRIDVKKETADVNVALDIALKRRPDYLAQLDVVEQGRLGIVVAENQRLWDLSLIGGASLGRQAQIGTGLTPISPKVVSASIGLALIAPLNDLRPEQNAIHAGTTLRDAEIQLSVIKTGVEQQVRLAVRGLDLDWRQVEAARRVEALSLSAVDAEKLRLSVGKSSTFQVQALEANYQSTRLQRLNAEVAYLNAVSQLDLQLGTTLDTWKIALRE